MANYIADDCDQDVNRNITNMTDFLNFQIKKPRPSEAKNLLSQFENKNWSASALEKQLLQQLEEKLEIKEIFNNEIKKATEYLNSVKPNYQAVLSEYKDFFSSN